MYLNDILIADFLIVMDTRDVVFAIQVGDFSQM